MTVKQSEVVRAFSKTKNRQIKQFIQRYAVVIVLLTSLLFGGVFTAVQYRTVVQQNQAWNEAQFSNLTTELTDKIAANLFLYEQVLRSAQALFNASTHVSRQEFQRFYQQLSLEQYYPGNISLGYVPLQGDLNASVVQQAKAIFLEPANRIDAEAYQFDLASDPTHLTALYNAGQTRQTVMLKSHTFLASDTQKSQSFMMILPVYGMTDALQGWVFIVFNLEDTVLQLNAHMGIASFEIHNSVTPGPDTLLYRVGEYMPPAVQYFHSLEIAQQNWTVSTQPTAQFIAQNERVVAWHILLFGTMLTVFIAAWMASLTFSRNRALMLARRMTQSLKEQNARLQLASHTLEVGVWILDFKHSDLRFDKQAGQIYGLTSEQNSRLPFTEWLNIISQPDQLVLQSLFEKMHQNHQSQEVIIHLVNQKVIRLNVVQQFNEKDQPIGLMGLSSDISDEWRHQNILEQAEKRWKYALVGIGEGVWDWRMTDNHVIFSENLITMMGYESHEFRAHVDEWLSRVHPEDFPHVMQSIEAMLDGSEPNYYNEHRALCKDGSWKWILDRGTVIERDIDGLPLRAIGTHSDIESRKQTEIALRQSEERFRNAFDTAAIGMALVGVDGKWIEVNPALCKMLEYEEAELLALTFVDITHPDDLPLDQEYVHRLINRELSHYQMEKRYFKKSGELITVLLSVSVVHAESGQVEHFVSQIEDITARKAEQEKVHLMAFYDVLTGLPNRRLFNERLNHAISLSLRSRNSLIVMFIDIDYFKQINDNYGHDTGDNVIKAVAQRMQDVLRSSDTVARLGGDEFVVLLEEVPDANTALQVAFNLREAFSTPILETEGDTLWVSLSIGLAMMDPQQPETVDSLMKKADIALYEVKSNGRDGAMLHHAD